MEIRLSQAVAVLAVLAIAIWLWAGSSMGGEPNTPLPSAVSTAVTDTSVFRSRGEGSAVPCAFPLAWRIARVDPRFDLSAGEVEEVVRGATSLWEGATGRDLFSHDPETGFPIRLVYDERQAASRDRRAAEAVLADAAAAIEAREAEIAETRSAYEEARRRYEERAESLRERVTAHNDSVQMWNERGGAPEGVARDLRAAEEGMRREELGLDARLAELERRRTEIEEAFRDLRSRARAWERRAVELREEFPSSSVEAGIYREAVTWRGDRVASIDREIRIYRFDDRNDLRRIAAHELGHAMGMGHADATGALMSERYARASGIDGAANVDAADLELLRARCPVP